MTTSGITNINAKLIHQHPDNPRKDLGGLSELSESIKKKGIMQNLTVIPGYWDENRVHHDEGYTLIIGHRRFAAGKMAGVTMYPCRIVQDMSYKDQVGTMLEENMQRIDLTPLEQQVQGTINGVKAQLRAQSSIAKKQTVRAVLFEDLDPDSPTFGAMCLGTLGFEIASERTADGRDWKWSTFGTGQGFFADFIVAGTMLADRIKGGTLELGGAGNGNGVAKVLNADGNEIVRLDKDGVYAKGKYVCANTDGSQTATLSNGKLTFKTESYEVVIRAGAIGGLTGLMIYPEQGAVRTKFLSIGDKLSARFDNISLLASGKTTIGGASLEVQRDGKGYSGKTGKAVFSDGTYLEYVNGFLVGGNTKEGGF